MIIFMVVCNTVVCIIHTNVPVLYGVHSASLAQVVKESYVYMELIK